MFEICATCGVVKGCLKVCFSSCVIVPPLHCPHVSERNCWWYFLCNEHKLWHPWLVYPACPRTCTACPAAVSGRDAVTSYCHPSHLESIRALGRTGLGQWPNTLTPLQECPENVYLMAPLWEERGPAHLSNCNGLFSVQISVYAEARSHCVVGISVNPD